MNISGNEIFKVCYETADVGAVYSVRRWSTQGVTIKNNYIHDLVNTGGIGSAAFYIDDLGSGATITENLVVNIPGRTTLMGGGRDNTITNNIQVNYGNGQGFNYDARGLGWAYYHAQAPDGECYGEAKALREHPDFDTELWTERYPAFMAMELEGDAETYNKGYYEEARKPSNAVIERNITVGVPGDAYDQVDNTVRECGSFNQNEQYEQGTDIGFVNPDAYDFTVKENSIITNLMGDDHFQVDQMGLYEDEFRKLEQTDLEKPVLISPEDRSDGVEFIDGAGFIWEPVKNAGSYTLEIAEDDAFTQNVKTVSTTTTKILVNDLEPETTYFWRVSARENKVGGAVSVSEIYSFTTSDNVATGFFDGFTDFSMWEPLVEGGAQKGKPSNTTEQAHSGTYSYVLDESMDVIQKKFGTPHNDVLSVWLYDNGQKDRGTTAMIKTSRQDMSNSWIGAGVNVEHNTGKGADIYACRINQDWYYSDVERTEGWHEFTFDYTTPGTCVISVDGNELQTITGEEVAY